MHKIQIIADPASIEHQNNNTIIKVYWKVEPDAELIELLSSRKETAHVGMVHCAGVYTVSVSKTYTRPEFALTAAEMTTLLHLIHYKVAFETPKTLAGNMIEVHTGSNLFQPLFERSLPFSPDIGKLINLTNHLRLLAYQASFVPAGDCAELIEELKSEPEQISSRSFADEMDIHHDLLVDSRFGPVMLTPVAGDKLIKEPIFRNCIRPYYDIRRMLMDSENLEIVKLSDRDYEKRKRKHGDRDFETVRYKKNGLFMVIEELQLGDRSTFMVRDLYVVYSTETYQKFKKQGLV